MVVDLVFCMVAAASRSVPRGRGVRWPRDATDVTRRARRTGRQLDRARRIGAPNVASRRGGGPRSPLAGLQEAELREVLLGAVELPEPKLLTEREDHLIRRLRARRRSQLLDAGCLRSWWATVHAFLPCWSMYQ